jgi:hypothetical protein
LASTADAQIANTVGAVVMALRIMWLAYRTFLLSDRERPLMASLAKVGSSPARSLACACLR